MAFDTIQDGNIMFVTQIELCLEEMIVSGNHSNASKSKALWVAYFLSHKGLICPKCRYISMDSFAKLQRAVT